MRNRSTSRRAASRAADTVDRDELATSTGTSTSESWWRSTRCSNSMSKAKPSTRVRANTKRATSDRNALRPLCVSRKLPSSTAYPSQLITRLPQGRLRGVVRRTVVDDDDLDVTALAVGRESLPHQPVPQPADGVADAVGLVV